MGAAIVVLTIFGMATLYAYLNLPPRYTTNHKAVSAYNQMVLLVCIALCSAWAFKAHSIWANTTDHKWWLPMAIGGALLIEVVFLTVFFLLRNFWIFKPPRRPGGGGFGF